MKASKDRLIDLKIKGMKLNKNKRRFLGWMAAASLMLPFASCTDDTFNSLGQDLSDEVTVSFNLKPEAASAVTRAIGSDAYNTSHIGDGGKADMLIYAVYDENGNLLEGYSNGTDPELKDKFYHGDGQTIKYIGQGKFPYNINITFKRGEKYTVAFWAQSSKTNAYDTSDLRKVEVKYSDVSDDEQMAALEEGDSSVKSGLSSSTPNNDEMRDAFCRSITIVAGQDGSVTQNVYLYRPLSQINVGTSGYDYEIVTRDANVKYTYSKIRINRVARYLDVVADKTITSTTATTDNDKYGGSRTPEAFSVVDFGWAPIPAYANMRDDNDQYQLPPYPSYTKFDWEYNKWTDNYAANSSSSPKHEDMKLSQYKKEEFLQVKLKETSQAPQNANWVDQTYNDYISYANLDNYYDRNTETFKWLSMCYVLTSSTHEEARVINNVKVWLAEDENGTNEKEIINIDHVPVQRNWRTNIVGEMLTAENSFKIMLDKDFAGEYNGWSGTDNWQWSGPLSNGVYYNAEEDVIEISSKDGLIWFQKMVNGDMLVRESGFYSINGTPAQPKQNYRYYDSTNKETPFEYNPYYPTKLNGEDELQKRILYATHQDQNKTEGGTIGAWPSHHNFHFVGNQNVKDGYLSDGRKAQATVRLMADIDLQGEEWIPIGFDGRIAETVRKDFVETDATNRGFYGIFDGNGHTIYNLSTKRFSARVHDDFQQNSGSNGPYDVLQWFGRGFFGMIGGNAKVKNLNIVNIDAYGCQLVGAIAGGAQGDAIEITNCSVDGGTLTVTPMYRGDTNNNKDKNNRTFARGVYLGGIVGYFNTVGGVVEDCEVRNITLTGYRRVGGIVGSINPTQLGDGKDSQMKDNFRESAPASISNNLISNSVILASQFSTFGIAKTRNSDNPKPNEDYKVNYDNGVISIGFNWNNAEYQLYSHEILGGNINSDLTAYIPDAEFKNNTTSGVTFSEFTSKVESNGTRKTKVQAVPLNLMPMLSAWYSDEIILNANYYGAPSAYKRLKLHEFQMFSSEKENNGYGNGAFDNNKTISNGGNVIKLPINLPYNVDIDWDKKSSRIGMYVGSVKLDGNGPNSTGGRSVVTSTGVEADGAAVMYICGENRHQYESSKKSMYKQPTEIRNMVIRGEPYANAGILLAPNKNMSKVYLNNVAVYDVYKTLALDDWSDNFNDNTWPYSKGSGNGYSNNYDAAERYAVVDLEIEDSNLRGYTVPGESWNSILYNKVTFGQGANIAAIYTSDEKKKEAHTCKVEATTTFRNCFFKAPYIIDLSDLKGGADVFFDGKNQATGASTNNVDIVKKTGCSKIVISSNAQGDPVVKYLDANGNELK